MSRSYGYDLPGSGNSKDRKKNVDSEEYKVVNHVAMTCQAPDSKTERKSSMSRR